MPFIQDWNNEQIEVAYSKGRVMAVADFSNNLIRHGIPLWPPGAIVQKLYNSRHSYAYKEQAFKIVTRRLEYYCDLQSVHSEDAITWSFFGPLRYLSVEDQAAALNWILSYFGLDGRNTKCEISLWRRIPHPQTLVPGGPEIDFLLTGDKDVVAGEAKWRSPFGIGQGVNRDMNQIQLRQRFLRIYGHTLFGNRRFHVLALGRSPCIQLVEPVQGVDFRSMCWTTLTQYESHPRAEEFQRYLTWKNEHSLA
ncbi:MAG TPA: hypothetical protein VGZ22_14045 [Isosphaeraceae bacterium]|jgi:hypothetical protein|nr:hypothetical protein [Isosphaeraceae bacterium]